MNGYVAGGWGVTAVLLALYAWRLVRRGRVLTRSLPDPPVRSAAPVPTDPAGSSTLAPVRPVTPGGPPCR